jgi:apolipoprotein N-acyltransferase
MQLDRTVKLFPGVGLVLGVAHGTGANAPHAWWLQLLAMSLALAAIFVAARRGRSGVSILTALGFSAASAASAHAWLLDALALEMQLGWPLATLVFGALVVLLCLLPALALACVTFLKPDRPMLASLSFAIAFPLCEITTNSLIGFAWSSAGYAPLGSPLASLYPWVGVYGVSAIVCLVAALAGSTIASFARGEGASNRANAPHSGLALGGAVGVALGAAMGASYFEATERASIPLRTRIVQPAVDQLEKFDGARMRAIAQQLAALARETTAQQGSQRAARLVVAPETALPHDWSALPTDVVDSLLQAVSSRGDTYLVGMFEADPVYGLLNVSNALRAGSRSSAPQRYVKIRLVPVAEKPTTGLRWLSDALALRYPARATLEEPPTVFEVGGVGVRTTICLDLAFGGDLSATAAATGVIVNQSNFGALPGGRVRAQFMTIARVRALEQGKPLLLVSNDGPSAAIDADGRVLATLPDGRPGALSVDLVPRNGVTPYAMLGEATWLAPLTVLVFALFVRSVSPASRRATLSRPPES